MVSVPRGVYDDLDDLRNPVLVNLLTGDVFGVTKRWNTDDPETLYLDELPLCDAPLLVCDLGAVELRRPNAWLLIMVMAQKDV